MLTEEEYSNEYDLDGIRSKKVSVITKYNINSGSGGGTVMSGGNSIQAVVKPPINQPEKKLISKTTKTHTYLTQNGKVIRDTLNTTVIQTKITRKTEILDFIYDESGRPFALIYTNGAADPVTYYYVLNLQGDVVALTDDTGAIVAEYVYNAWGEKLHILDSDGNEITSSSNIAIINPLRYRGYYYDTETGFYYLQSRYYDPVTHRFINADSYASTDSTDAIACNMFAYCGNNPVIHADETGFFWKEIGNFFKKVGKAISGFAKKTFGAGSTVLHQVKHEVEHSPAILNMFISLKSGVRNNTRIASSGDSTKPISVYAQGRTDEEILSSVGLKINISDFTANISLGLDNIGITGSLTNGNNVKSFGLTADISQLKIGIESAQTIKHNNFTETTSYTNASVTAWGILAILIFAKTGEWCPSPQVA